MMKMYVEIPHLLTENSVIQEFGTDAYRFHNGKLQHKEEKENERN